MKSLMNSLNALSKIATTFCLLAGLLSGCASTAGSAWSNFSDRFQSNKNQPAVPEVKLNFALPDDIRKDPITLKSVGVIENCDLSGTCSNAPTPPSSSSLFNRN